MEFLQDFSLDFPQADWGSLLLFLSPSSQHIAVVTNLTVITILSTRPLEVVHTVISDNISEVQFGIDDSYIIVNCGSSVKNYSLSSFSWAPDLYPFEPTNSFTSLQLTPNYTRLLLLNHSSLHSRTITSG